VTPELVAHSTAFPVTVEIPELGIGQIYRSAEDLAPIVLPQVEPWSAER
jgi:beta-galactosidase